MSSKPHTDSVYVPKRKPKNPIHFQIQLNEEQKEAKRLILENKITFIKGKAGSGKSQISVIVALDTLFKKDVERIIITRPMVTSGEEWGFLPGGINEKISPFTAPIYDCMYSCYGKEKIDKLIEDGLIEVVPMGFMRGRNFSRAFVICDEAQNCSFIQLKMLLTRFCKGSRMVVNGDTTQIDLPRKEQSGFESISRNLKGINDIGYIILASNHRDEIVDNILDVLDAL
jgi:phosphate starvation-inducible PhoH-like protein